MDFNETITQIKEGLKGFLTTESTKEQVDKIAELDKLVDTTVTDYNKVANDYSNLKTDYINVIKNSGFKSDKDPGEVSPPTNKNINIDTFISDFIANKNKENK